MKAPILRLFVVVTVIAILWPPAAGAQPVPVRRYTTEDGLAHDRVNCIVPDSMGFIWLCTARGLSRFDGYAFATFDERHGLPSASVNHVMEAAPGEYWVATEGGVCRFQAAMSRCMSYPLGSEARDRRANLVHRDRSGALWAATFGDTFRLAAGAKNFERVPVGNLAIRGMRAIADDALGGMWFGSRTSVLQRLPKGGFRRRTFGAEPEEDGAAALLADRDGRIWVGHRSGLIIVKPADDRGPLRLGEYPGDADPVKMPPRPGDSVRLRTFAGRPLDGVRALFQAENGAIWLALRDGGVLRFEDGRFHHVPEPPGLKVFDAVAFGADRAGNIWVGTVANGAVKLARQPFANYDASRGLPAASILSIFEDHGGALVVVMADGTLGRFDGTRFTTIRPNLPPDFVSGISQLGPLALQDRAGTWWFRTGDELVRFAVPSFDALARASPSSHTASIAGLTYDRFSRMRVFEDSAGDIWIGGSSRKQPTLTRWHRATGAFEARALPDTVRYPPAFFIEDQQRNLWLGMFLGGLVRCGPKDCVAIEEGAMQDVPVNGFYLDERGRLWIAADHAGLRRIDDPGAARPTLAEQPTHSLGGSIVRSITGDRSGRLYVGTENGVDRLDLATGRTRHFAATDGLASNEQQVAYRDRQGTLWFGTVRGLSSYLPPPDETGAAPPVHISDVRIAGDSQPLSATGAPTVAGLQLEPDRNHLQVDFASVAAAGDMLRYQYQLAGVDVNWSAPRPERTVTYARLPPGDYEFQVRAVNADGAASTSPATVAFRVLAPFWRQGWFLALGLAVFALAGAGAYRYRVRRLIELERVRTRIASDLHDDIGSTLSQIAILGEVVRARIGSAETAVEETLARIITLSRQSVDSMSDLVWAIDPHKDRLDSLAQRMRRHASDVLPPLGITFTFEVGPPPLARYLASHGEASPKRPSAAKAGADVRREVMLAFKEVLNNAIRHAECRAIAVSLRTDRSWLVLTVTDDGRGFDPARVTEGHGLGSLRRRAEGLGGSLEISGSPGTRVTLRIPHT